MPILYYQKQTFTYETFLNMKKDTPFVKQVQKILKGWSSGQDVFSLFTSGSTDEPKEVLFSRKQLEISARQTFETFKLAQGDCLLCCLSPEHAAGFMMIIRSLIYDCDLILVEPCANPMQHIASNTNIDFAAFVPYQMQAILNAGTGQIKVLDRMKAIIIGGGIISDKLRFQLEKLSCPLYHTYGMTETLTHVAVRDLKNRDSSFHALKNVEFRMNENKCLVIKSPLYPNKEIITQDMVKLLSKNRFEWLGRFDQVINSGGIKIHINQLELQIQKMVQRYFPDVRIYISSLKDSVFGEIVVLLIEAEQQERKFKQLKESFKNELKSFEIPKKVFFIQNFEYTSLGKIDRIKSLKLLKENG